jgi:hypothetical protein
MKVSTKHWLTAALALTVVVSTLPGYLAQAANQQPLLSYPGSGELAISFIGRYSSGAKLSEGGTEIVDYEQRTKTMFSVNGSAKALDMVSLSGLQSGKFGDIPLKKRIPITELAGGLKNISDLTSVAVSPNGAFVAIAVPAEPATDSGFVVFVNAEGSYLSHVQVGSLPDAVTFSPDGRWVISSNEGSPSDDYKINPEGSVSMIDVSGGVAKLTQAQVTTVRFTDTQIIDPSIRKVKADATYAQDFEPEYTVIAEDSKTAYVVLQENNAIATLDLTSRKFTSVRHLGFKDHSLGKNAFDASNRDNSININPWPVLGMYQPDGLALYTVKGKSYLITPNEGDAQDYSGFSEEARIKDLANQLDLKAENYKGVTQGQLDHMVKNGLLLDSQLGRLLTTTAMGKNANGKYEALYAYGARSFSIWDASNMKQVFDSGNHLEFITAAALGKSFNVSNSNNTFDDRSDDKGPEPETAAVGHIAGHHYAFVGLERSGGIVAYNVSQPQQPVFVEYFSSRQFNGKDVSGDLAPEGLKFVPATGSPTGNALLLAAHEVSGTIAVYELKPSAKAKK